MSFKGNSSWSRWTKAPGIRRNWDRALEHAAIVQEINEAEERLLGNARQHYRSVAFNPIIDQPAGKRGPDLETCDVSVRGHVNNTGSPPGGGGGGGLTLGSVSAASGDRKLQLRATVSLFRCNTIAHKGFSCVFLRPFCGLSLQKHKVPDLKQLLLSLLWKMHLCRTIEAYHVTAAFTSTPHRPQGPERDPLETQLKPDNMIILHLTKSLPDHLKAFFKKVDSVFNPGPLRW